MKYRHLSIRFDTPPDSQQRKTLRGQALGGIFPRRSWFTEIFSKETIKVFKHCQSVS
jgi:hypothetical protein